MNKKSAILIAILILIFAFSPVFASVNIREIERVRKKAVLDGSDSAVVEQFLADAIAELVNMRDYSSISRAREMIVANEKSTQQSARQQYEQIFTKAAHKAIKSGFIEASQLDTPQRQFLAELNLVILLAELQDLGLADISIEKLQSTNSAVRYWAVKSLTGAELAQQINDAGSSSKNTIGNIIKSLKDVAQNTDPSIIAMVADFSVNINLPESEDLLLAIAGSRIKKYAASNVEDELVDIPLLKALYQKLGSAPAQRKQLAKEFCQLYSYVFQRYISGFDTLSDSQKANLTSVLVEIEDKIIDKITGIKQSKVKRLLENNDTQGLQAEHDRLLGSDLSAGAISTKLNVKYGPDNASTAPEKIKAE
ncbi:MAG: hypothetical protein H8D47_00675 [Planctomycetes bacterium]|nr:hypothetical protein [Planctomycetota bacterium]